MGTELGKWLIEEYGEKKSSNTARAWRAGKVEGIRHPKMTPKLKEQFGRKEILEQAALLENEGLIKVDWTQVRTDIKAIDFPMANLDRLYEFEGVPNPKKLIKRQKEYLEQLLKNTKEEWLSEYFTSLYEQLLEGNMPSNAMDSDLLRCIYELARLEEYQFKRMFSEKIFHNSKTFEKSYEKKVITVLRKSPSIDEEMVDYEVLAEFKILTYSQSLAWKGNLTYCVEGTCIDGTDSKESVPIETSNMIYGTVLNAQTLVNSKPVKASGIRRVVTIENQANYENMKYDKHTLYIFVHGFPSPKERRFLEQIVDIVEEGTEFYHWSDMDLGGIRIYRFLKQNLFPNLQPMKMDAESYQKAIDEGHGINYDEKKQIKYETLHASGQCPEELKDLLSLILEHGKDIEQEGV